MSQITRNEATPIIIKGKACGSDIAGMSCIDISGQVFKVDTEYHSDSQEWVKSTTRYPTSGIDSVEIGEDGPNHQYCKAYDFKRPLTVKFKAIDDRLLFTITEEKDENGNYDVTISSDSGTYFTITQASASSSNEDDWDESDGAFPNPIHKIHIIDSSDDPTCCSILTNGEKLIYVNVRPPANRPSGLRNQDGRKQLSS
jgi:hypothetical protein